MKKLLLIGLTIACCNIYWGCKSLESNDANNIKMRDSVFATIPSINGIKIEVKNNKNVNLLIYSKGLYDGSENERLATVEELTRMTVAIYEDNNYLKTGKVYIVASNTEVSDVSTVPNKEYTMNFEPLLKKNN